MSSRITVVGSMNVDLVFRTPRMPVVGETITGDEFRQVPGGKGANQAVAAARQGGDVAFVGCVGDDSFAEGALSCLRAEHIDISTVGKVPNTSTGVAAILVDASGHNSIVLAPGANGCVTVERVDAAAALIGAAKWLICQLEIPLASVQHAIELARKQGAKVVFNPAPMLPLTDALLAQVDYLVVNETEAGQMSGIDVVDAASAAVAAQKLRERGIGTVLLTMGEHGICLADQDGARFTPALKVEVVDTTAAGDTFVGAFTVGMAHGLSVDVAAMEAQYTAALTVTKLGAQTSIPTRAEVVAFMRSRGAEPAR
jgi:ribokinase